MKKDSIFFKPLSIFFAERRITALFGIMQYIMLIKKVSLISNTFLFQLHQNNQKSTSDQK